MTRKKIVLFGAGATGRAHVGLLAWQAGFEMVFVEKRPELVAALREAGAYHVRLLYGDARRDVTVTGFRVYASTEREKVASEIVDAALVLTSVFDQNLHDVAETLALAAKACRAVGRTEPLNCIACENMMDSSSKLGQMVQGHLSDANLAYARQTFGFPDCMISRVVPQPEGDPLQLIAEDYNEWTASAAMFKGAKPALDALTLVENQASYLERKLFIHNGGHAICGYFGFHRGHRYVHEALGDAYVVEHVLGGVDQLAAVVQRKHGFLAEEIEHYKDSLGPRGAIAEMRDAIARVVRDPIRKLSSRERLVAPARLACEYGLPHEWIVRGIVAALRYSSAEDPQSLQLAHAIEQDGLRAVLARVCELPADHPLTGEIEAAWREWRVPMRADGELVAVR